MDSVRARTASTHIMMTIFDRVRKRQGLYLTHLSLVSDLRAYEVKAAIRRYKRVSAARKTAEGMKVTARELRIQPVLRKKNDV